MIRSFRNKGLEKFFYNGDTSKINPKHAEKIAMILDHLDAALKAEDMNYPGSGFHKLSGKLKNFYAVKVSGNWRIIFLFEEGDALEVDYLDYH